MYNTAWIRLGCQIFVQQIVASNRNFHLGDRLTSQLLSQGRSHDSIWNYQVIHFGICNNNFWEITRTFFPWYMDGNPATLNILIEVIKYCSIAIVLTSTNTKSQSQEYQELNFILLDLLPRQPIRISPKIIDLLSPITASGRTYSFNWWGHDHCRCFRWSSESFWHGGS